VRCSDCGCYYTNPTLFPQGNPYAQDTPAEYFRAHDAQRKREAGQHLARHAEALLGRRGCLLEIGCGRGELLDGARDVGWQVFGIEMTEAFARVAESRGIDVERERVETAEMLESRAFDVVLLPAILEHLYQPVNVLRRVRSAVVRDGVIFVDVPNEDSLVMRLGNLYMRFRGRDWAVNLSPTFSPYHVVGFTPRSLSRALVDTGFHVVQLTTPRWANLLPPARTFIEHLEHKGVSAASWVGRWVGLGDGICCWARAT
jgi:2-polyprenyl-3-methyl-5-hydroxy-6-metoxy-1,4-benzoquinol methylase